MCSAVRLQRDRWASDTQPDCCSCSKCWCLPGVSVDEVQFVSPNEQCVWQTPPHILLIVVDFRRSCSLLNFRLSIPPSLNRDISPPQNSLCLLYIFISFFCLLCLLLLLSPHCSPAAPLSSLTKLMIAVQEVFDSLHHADQSVPKHNNHLVWKGTQEIHLVLLSCSVMIISLC